MKELLLLASGRLYPCARCHELVAICRDCDYGNIYCFGECSQIRRIESKRRASKTYQDSFKGKLNHAACEARRRARQKEKVTDHGYQNREKCASLVSNEIAEAEQPTEAEQPAEADQPAKAEQDGSQLAKAEKAELARPVTEAKDMEHCHCCGIWCGPFLRLEPWRGGRYYKRQRGMQHGSTRRHRGRDSPASLRREVAKKHNS